MIDKTELLDPAEAGDLSRREKEVIEDAQNAGISSDSTEALTDDNPESPGGVTGQTVNIDALEEIGKPGGESDISGGISNLDETTEAPVGENEYNR